MKKLTLMLAAIAFCAIAATASDRFTGTLTVAADGTTAVTTNDLFKADGPPCGDIDTIVVTCESGSGTGTVVFAVSEYGKTDTITTSGALMAGDVFFDRPLASESILYTQQVAQNVVTGKVVLLRYSLQTNYLVQAKSYLARQLRVSVTQGAVADVTVYKWTVFTRTDPPPPKK